MHTPSLDISLRVAAPIATVWTALTEPRFRELWWPASQFTPNAGEPFAVDVPYAGKKKPRRASGTITAIDHDAHELHVAWVRSPGKTTTKVHVLVTEAKRRSKIRIIEEGFAANDHDVPVIVAASRDGWRDVLAALADFLERDEHLG